MTNLAHTVAEAMLRDELKHSKRDFGFAWEAESEIWLSNARAAINAIRDHFDAGQFDQWSSGDLAAQCRMQAKDNLDPEYARFMHAVANRLASGIAARSGETAQQAQPEGQGPARTPTPSSEPRLSTLGDGE